MTSDLTSDSNPQLELKQSGQRLFLSLLTLVVTLMLFRSLLPKPQRSPADPTGTGYSAPLVMQGGDPYIRALMRTISAAESNSTRPYSVLYGGEHFEDFSHHPDQCMPILVGPNAGDCSTAAGRYQFITTTWLEKAAAYHPAPSGLWFSKDFSFTPEFQDQVTYRWLADPDAWNADLSTLLQQGQLQEVLSLLSSTWTSLGYGIEPNQMTESLPGIYQQMLQEELAKQS